MTRVSLNAGERGHYFRLPGEKSVFSNMAKRAYRGRFQGSMTLGESSGGEDMKYEEIGLYTVPNRHW